MILPFKAAHAVSLVRAEFVMVEVFRWSLAASSFAAPECFRRRLIQTRNMDNLFVFGEAAPFLRVVFSSIMSKIPRPIPFLETQDNPTPGCANTHPVR